MAYEFRTKTLKFVPLAEKDIPYLYSLRKARPNNFLSPIDQDIDLQYQYFRNYLTRYEAGKEVYYKILNPSSNDPYGFVRVTSLQGKSTAGWESLILSTNCPAPTGIDVCFTIYFYVLSEMRKSLLGPWFVGKDNRHMMAIHKHMGLVSIADETADGYFLIVTRSCFEEQKERFLRLGFCNEFSKY